MFDILMKNNIHYLAQVMIANGYKGEIADIKAETILSNMRYLAKESGGNMWLPFTTKRILEKVICGYTNTAFEFNDGTDVYFETIGENTVCVANVYWVQYDEQGGKRVLGHGFHCLPLTGVIPSEAMTTAKRVSLWKALTIGAAKSRALYEGGIGLEFYGDMLLTELDFDEVETEAVGEDDDATKITSEKKDSTVTYSESGMPIPQPKKKRPKKDKESEPVAETPTSEETQSMSYDFANGIKADVGNYSGMTLGEIYDVAPKNLIFLARNSKNADVVTAATVIIKSDKDLKEKYSN